MAAWFSHRSKSTASDQAAPKITTQPESTAPTENKRLERFVPSVTAEPELPPPGIDPSLTHRRISEAIDAVPPFKRDDVAKGFMGLWVSWPGNLLSVSRHEETLMIVIETREERYLVFCTASPSDCTSITHSPAKSPIIVEGKIQKVSTHEASLVNCRIKSDGSAST